MWVKIFRVTKDFNIKFVWLQISVKKTMETVKRGLKKKADSISILAYMPHFLIRTLI